VYLIKLFYAVETSRTSQKLNSSALKNAPFQGEFFFTAHNAISYFYPIIREGCFGEFEPQS